MLHEFDDTARPAANPRSGPIERQRSVVQGGAAPDSTLRIAGGSQEPLPLSFAQQRLWCIDQIEPGSSAYNLPFALKIDGPLNDCALRRSLYEVVRRHKVLRSRFLIRLGEPIQEVMGLEQWVISV